MTIQIQNEIIEYEDYLKRIPDSNSIKEVLKILRDFGIKIKKENVPQTSSNFELLQWKKKMIWDKFKLSEKVKESEIKYEFIA